MTATLVALINGAAAGTVTCGPHIRLSFAYDERWIVSPNAIALSLSLPLGVRNHRHDAITAFLWGLLPDNEQTLERWARQFQVSPRNPFSLLTHVGEDCPGAVQFATPERARELSGPAPSQIAWLTPKQIAERLRALHNDPSLWRRPGDIGQFSLAGAQPKIALLKQGRRWGIPSGRTPTTHILKPPIAGFDGHAENEHFCLNLARRLGLPVCVSEVRRFDDQPVIVVTRFDRVAPNGEIVRVHQEDLCQAMGLLPSANYQNQEGATPEQIVTLLRSNSSAAQDDIQTFVAALAYNWIIGGTDAHAKNYALLHGSGGRIRLAPLYDVASVLPYPGIDAKRAKLAMKIGDTYEMEAIGPRQWRKFAEANKLKPDETLEAVGQMIRATPDAVEAEMAACQAEGLDHPVLGKLAEIVRHRARKLARGWAS
ncbi:MAG TPA: type II toxin-antitoxin system HipA family toxin [Alphaproteobacteria bacterium]|nr:type II toxin-antitoxin system HipA family toxin [Alphaproteobacteria bacterium]HAJ45754.1 type II toxin-antitoxin system HipA family toxin [Alphaproteobacteria bacterium]